MCWILFDLIRCDGSNHKVPEGRWCAGLYSIDAAVMGGITKYQKVGGVLGLIQLMPL